MERVISDTRQEVAAAERAAVAREVAELVETSGLSRAEFATKVGTSTSRLSTYITGKVTPSAALMLRMRRLGAGLALLAMPPPPGNGPKPDWEDQKQEMLDAPMRKLERTNGKPAARLVPERQGGGFASLAGVWRGRVRIGDNFDELPNDPA